MEIDEKMKSRLFIVPVTAIVVRRSDRKFLLLKRSPNVAAFPNQWTVPGGKFEEDDFSGLPYTTKSYPGRYGVLEPAVRREVREEAGIEIDTPRYLTNYTFPHPKGFNVLGISFWAWYASGEVTLHDEDIVDFRWATLDEANSIGLIEGIYGELVAVSQLVSAKA